MAGDLENEKQQPPQFSASEALKGGRPLWEEHLDMCRGVTVGRGGE